MLPPPRYDFRSNFSSDDSFLLNKYKTVRHQSATMRPTDRPIHNHLSRREKPEPPSDDEMADLPSAKRLKYARKCTTNGDRPADQLLRYDLGNTFEVLVGAKPDQQSFTVYHDIATQRSRFFRAARSNRWTDPTKPTELVDDEPSIFHAYLHCLYFDEKAFLGKKTGAEVADNDKTNDKNSSQVGETMRFVFDVYMLADKLLDPTTANVVMEKLVRHSAKHSCTLDNDTITYLYASTADGSPLRKVIRDGAIQDLKSGWTGYVPKQEWDLPYEFLQDPSLRLLALSRSVLKVESGPPLGT
jgi:hypothetical protein